ncbi:hypothetical protein N499_0470 [Wolbachia pipientis wVitA]|nr:hypothetical protein N499_0470 [Wolbachia pipientis wVitA]
MAKLPIGSKAAYMWRFNQNVKWQISLYIIYITYYKYVIYQCDKIEAL